MIPKLTIKMYHLFQIREYHRKHPAARVVDANEEYEALLKEEPQIEFSGEVGPRLLFSNACFSYELPCYVLSFSLNRMECMLCCLHSCFQICIFFCPLYLSV